jgi:predicted tellurium resistance membrane protein TerC
MEHLLTVDNALALLTLTALEIVLGVDNVIFIAILVGRLPEAQRKFARQLGLFLAMALRIGLLMSLTWMMKLTDPLFTVFGHPVSGRDLILLVGGAFLIAKATYEIHHRLEAAANPEAPTAVASFASTIVQILLLDIVFSLDSVITAVGMAQQVWVMVTAIVIAVGVMMLFAGAISRFIDQHPTFKVLALSFLILIGFTLILDGSGKHVDKGYIYFAMGFSFVVELLNIKLRPKKPAPAPKMG